MKSRVSLKYFVSYCRTSLITIFKSLIRPHLDYGDIIYDRAYNTLFHQNIESIQYNTALAITGTVRRTSREKLYQELGLNLFNKHAGIKTFVAYSKLTTRQRVISFN